MYQILKYFSFFNNKFFLVPPSEILGIEMEESLTNSLKNTRKRDKVVRDKRNMHNPALQAGGKCSGYLLRYVECDFNTCNRL